MGSFDNIRPYNDDEVVAVLQRLSTDPDFLNVILRYRYPALANSLGWLLRPLVAWRLRKEIAGISNIADLQARVAPYVEHSVRKATDGISFTGIDNLDPDGVHLYLANHRDIVMDPAYVNYALYQAGFATPRLAIGDNLLQKPFISDLMRLNKSFIVPRSVTGRREKLEAFQQLSSYINHSMLNEHSSVWIAQAEGRAKDGDDRTDSAILKMLHMSQRQLDFVPAIARLNLTPVAISYEYDPCDLDKARELYILATTGSYEKQPGEDDASIAKGITGYKGRVHVHFDAPLTSGFADARELANRVDHLIWQDYRLFPVNYLAWHQWNKRDTSLSVPAVEDVFSAAEVESARTFWLQRLQQCPAEHQPYLVMQYANPLQNQYRSLAAL
ncbi:MAG: glycerol acyltransferase [Gammaproteobacteria bacterium]|nr:glycerol acyltransferase [Gammaproteobacteria bacterium]